MKDQVPTPSPGLLASARTAFLEKGLEATTRDIARGAGAEEAGVLDRLGPKCDLFLLAMAPSPTSVVQLIGRIPHSWEPKEQFREVFLLTLGFFRELVPVLLTVAGDLEFEYETFARRNPNSPPLRLEQALREFLRRHAPEGTVPPFRVDAARLNLFNAACGLAFQEALGTYGGPIPDSIVREQAEFLLTSLTTPVDEAPPDLPRSPRQ